MTSRVRGMARLRKGLSSVRLYPWRIDLVGAFSAYTAYSPLFIPPVYTVSVRRGQLAFAARPRIRIVSRAAAGQGGLAATECGADFAPATAITASGAYR